MKIVKHAKYVGTLIGPEGHLHRWNAPRKKFTQRYKKINETSKSLVQRLVDFKIYALSVLGHVGFFSAPDEVTLKEESHALLCTTAGPYNAMPTDLLRVGSVCGLGSDLRGVHIISLAVRSRTAARSGTLAHDLAKIQTARESDHVALQTLTPAWEERFLKTSMAFSTMEAYEDVCQIDGAGNVSASPARNLQKAATNLLCSTPSKTRFLSTNFRKCLQEC